jgi:hypothetical protein
MSLPDLKEIISDAVATADTKNIQPIKNFLPKKCKNVNICLRLMHLSNQVSLSLSLQPFPLPVLANFQPKCHFRILKDIISDAVATWDTINIQPIKNKKILILSFLVEDYIFV